ncbi:MAG: DNA-binding protein [Azospirillum brasilense]|nr:MAG: DNA-binding protein [Azospirillum brasilense]
MHKLYTTGEVAKLLNVSKAWLEYHRWKGDGIPFIRLQGTRSVRYLEEDIKAWLASQKKLNVPKEGGSYASY